MAGRTAASRFTRPTATSSSGSNNSPRRSEFQSSPTYATARPMLKATTSGESHFAPGRASPLLNNGAFDHGRVSPTPTHKALTKTQIEDAIARSKDDGCTLDFSNRELSEIGELAAEQLSLVRTGEEDDEESCILRIALVGNNLSTLPRTFALLSRLRYLTLRSNAFTEFPEVLTQMPALEILDFSRNKLRRLPSDPGSLVNLRVMSISRNKIRKLPTYLSKFRFLTVLKADHNPIEWPPSEVVQGNEDLEDPEAMGRWVGSLKTWMASNHSDESSPFDSPRLGETNNSIDQRPVTNDEESVARVDAGITPHARSFSVDSQGSAYTSSSFGTPLQHDDVIIKDHTPERPPPLTLVNVSPTLPPVLSASPDSYLPTPDNSLEDDIPGPLPLSSQFIQDRDRQHGRNRSYAYEGQNVRGKGALTAQKSLPDLRNARTHFAPKEIPDMPVVSSKVNGDSSPARNYITPSSSLDKAEGHSPAAPQPSSEAPSLRSRPIPRPGKQMREGPAPSLDFERNSYFRRLSTLPASTIARTIPPALLTVVDRVRGILFAVSQIYQSLQHYTVYAIDERLSAVLLKVLDPASTYMLQLITDLDKFDASSRKGFPPPSVCRRVVESCRDNVAVFGKAIGVLALQLKVLASHDDVRYSRQMLLVLYGAMSEVSHAWQGMATQLDVIEPLLRDAPVPPVPKPLSLASSATAIKAHSSSRVLIPPIAERPEPSSNSAPPVPAPLLPRPHAPSLSRTHSAQPFPGSPPSVSSVAMKRPSTSEGRARNRRHAGSFSVKDVEIGRSLPSNFDEMHPSAIVNASSAPISRTQPPLPRNFPMLTSIAQQGSSSNPASQNHSRQSSANAPALTIPSLAGPSRSLPSLEVPSNSTTLVDKEAIDAMAGAVKAAPAVWSMLDEISSALPESPLDLRDSLSKAQDVTNRLGENIRAIQEGLPSADRKALREDAHVFVKTVISLSKVVKDYGSAHSLSAQLRKDIAKLTNATQEFVILLHVSSFSPSSTPRPYSPMPNGISPVITPVASSSAANGSLMAESGDKSLQLQISSGLSRSRSAQPPASTKLSAPTSSSVPRSALPNQSFKIPVLGATPSLGTSARTNSRLRNGDTLDADGHG
ncbi:hypothetical protein SCHPADRAFT_903067 [Schizopora paradoxa]|uniref:RAM signaling pathway protein n=1 Tax=Schizopora paradoxa TaxID=27342 RepID=A0A0H2SCH2_9AGAM|nr:hypothetical protein SCHPADRAFT_903067 [Schizopora paradoxa]